MTTSFRDPGDADIASMNDDTAFSAIVTPLRIRDGADPGFSSWQARMTAAAAAAPGFVSIEFIPVFGSRREWQMVLRFRDAQGLAGWRSSRTRNRLHEEVMPLLDDGEELDERAAPDLHGQGSVTEVITTHVKPGADTAFLDWSARILRTQAGFPGYRGMYLQAPSEGQAFWTSLIRFATPMQLDAWLASPERHRLVRESEALVEAWSGRRLGPPFAGWFPAEAVGGTPPDWKQAMVVLLTLFPIVVLELRFLVPMTQELDPVLGTFLGNAISVGLLAWPVMPLANRALDWWLRPPLPRVRWITPLGVAFLLGLYVVEILGLRWLA
jgi:antibiotic biosynthesis monooxygenase (ABM) superfamily enzyme